ncbi:MAG: phospholipid/cholesterol/gamma-HCH transport system substrate-binding protein [Chlamydiales bacterium]|jgi:phospholipid/cholesterol/gamma-HCH transport system substrate-binding protein
MSSNRNVILGFFFVAVVAILSYYTVFMTDFQLLGEPVRKTVYFTETNGLREGDSVLVAGVRWGKIESADFDPRADRERRIKVTISLDETIGLHADYKIQIKDATLLGGKNLVIDPGLPNSPVIPEDRELYGSVSSNVLQALDDVVAENREAIRTTLGDIQTIVADIRAGRGIAGRILADEELAASFSSAISSISGSFDNVEVLTKGLREGEGTFGRLFTEDVLYEAAQTAVEQARDLLSDARTVIADVRQGRGTIGRLLYDEGMSEDVATSLNSIGSITQSIDEGKGALGRMVRDEKLAEDMTKFVGQLTSDDSTVGRLMTRTDLYDNFLSFSDDLAATMRTVRSGEGTVGRLINDDELYTELQRALATLTGSLEEAREAAPISTFLGTIFLGF